MTEIKPGDRVELVRTSDPYLLIRRGDQGTVKHVDIVGTIRVQWDNGSTIGMLPDVDEIRLVTEEDD